MSYSARVFRILIASPSDVSEEREVAVKVIQEWNDLNLAERQVVLLPLRWESHSAPEYGKRPQEIINRQVVDKCDVLLGIFWTRIGSPTGEALSGTLEEIERVAKEGKLVMLYFSRARQDPDEIVIDQISKLREFKKNTFPKGLVEHYSTIIEFRDKIAKQLEIQIRGLLSEQNASGDDALSRSPTTDIQIGVANPENGQYLGKILTLETKYIVISDFNLIPDFESKEEPFVEKTMFSFSLNTVNKNYYREFATYLVQKNMLRPFRMWMKNEGGVGARDVYVDIQLRAKSGTFVAVTADSIPSGKPSKFVGSILTSEGFLSSPEQILGSAVTAWSTYFEIKALQPKREVCPKPLFYIGAQDNVEIEVTTRTFADTLPEPYVEFLSIDINVSQVKMSGPEFIVELNRGE